MPPALNKKLHNSSPFHKCCALLPPPPPLYASGLEKATPFKWSIFIKDMKMAHWPKAMRLKKKQSEKRKMGI